MELNNVYEGMLNETAKTIIEKNLDNIKTGDMDVIPCNTGVLVRIYDENPYRAIERTSSGLYIGIQSNQTYKSDETGEVTRNEEAVACAEVLAVGPACKNVNIGEDVYFLRSIAMPVPFRKQSLYIISEQNIWCRVFPKNVES